MARQKLNYTQGDAEPKKKANQKRSQLATGQSTCLLYTSDAADDP